MERHRVRFPVRRLLLIAAFCLSTILIFLAHEGYDPEHTLLLLVAGLLIWGGLWALAAYGTVLNGRSEGTKARRSAESELAIALYCTLAMAAQVFALSESRGARLIGTIAFASGVLAGLWGLWQGLPRD